MPKEVKRIAINTGGGDAPGLNAVIRAVVLSALRRGWEVWGIEKGYRGLFKEGGIYPLTRDAVRGITHVGGTILGTTNKGDPFHFPAKQPDGTVVETDISDQIVDKLREHDIDALIAVGGDGSMRISHGLAAKGVNVIGVPKTIDNDLAHTVVTFGFDTAVSIATEGLDRLHSTAEAHERVMVVEVMGRYAGWIALHAGVSATADVVLLPEIPFDIDVACEKIMARERNGRCFSIVVVAEGATPKGEGLVTKSDKEMGSEVRLGGIGEQVASAIGERTGKECRTVVLGHLQRGGTPSTFDRLIALRFGAAAVRAIAEGRRNVMVALNPPTVKYVSLDLAIERMKTVPLGSDTVQTARDLGMCLGDE